MKRFIFAGLLLVLSVAAYAQDMIALCISYLRKPVPAGFVRVDRTNYKHPKEDIVITVDDGIIGASTFAGTFEYSYEASVWLGAYYTYLEEHNWTFSARYSEKEADAYTKDGLVAFCVAPKTITGEWTMSLVTLCTESFAKKMAGH
jgi:hypothetical protein